MPMMAMTTSNSIRVKPRLGEIIATYSLSSMPANRGMRMNPPGLFQARAQSFPPFLERKSASSDAWG
jgi:hypothetical protein